MPLEKLLQNDKLRGKWKWKELFTYARVIHWWGIWPPSKFFEASTEDQAFAVATYETEMGIQAWDSYVSNLEQQNSFANLSHDK